MLLTMRWRVLISVALIGCGSIGGVIARFIDDEMHNEFTVNIVYDDLTEYAETLSKALVSKPRVVDNAEMIFSDPNVRLVIEAASQNAAKIYVPRALAASKDVMIMSVGALADEQFYREIRSIAESKKKRIFIPSGAIAGLDWIKAATQVGLDRVSIVIRKPPRALEGSPFVTQNEIALSSIHEPTQIYEGPAADAVVLFPANVNVACALSIAGIGSKKTLVRVIADPTVAGNTHEISAEGAAGKITIKVENVPSPTNPRTSWVAALSANQKLREMVSSISIGT